MDTFIAELAAGLAVLGLGAGVTGMIRAGRYAERLDRLQKAAESSERAHEKISSSISKLHEKIDEKTDRLTNEIHEVGVRVATMEGRILNGKK